MRNIAPDNPLGNKIKIIRRQYELSQRRFGKKIGVSGKTISSYETGKSSPPLKILETIASVYNVSFVSMQENNKGMIRTKIQSLEKAINDLKDEINSALPL